MNLNSQIVGHLRSRNEEGLSLLYKHYSESLYGMTFRVLGNEAFAEDALQQGFLKIWNNIDQFDESRSTLFTWMAAIVRNTSIDIRRLKSFQAETKTDSLDPYVSYDREDYIQTDSLDAIKLLENIDEKYAFVLEYLYLRGYSQSELADEFDIPLGTIKTRVKKGIELLRSKLSGEKKYFLGIFVLVLLLIIKLL